MTGDCDMRGRIISSYIHTQTMASIAFLQSSSYDCECCLGPTQEFAILSDLLV